jgi:hypothetical protein
LHLLAASKSRIASNIVMRRSIHVGKWIGTALPLLVLAASLGWFPETRYGGSNQSPDGDSASPALQAGLLTSKRGFGSRSRYFHRDVQRRGAFSKSSTRTASAAASSRTRSGYVSADTKPSRRIFFKKPEPARAVARRSTGEKELTVSKSSVAYTRVKLGQKRPRWKFLTPIVRAQIDRANISKGRWRYIVIHNSATSRGNAKAFDRYHRNVKKMSNGMAYHFVVGNGSYSGNGEVEIGDRWKKQIHGGHMKSMAQNRMAIGICLVGDFNSQRVRDGQLEALDELVTYLQAKCGKAVVTTHRSINVVPTTCPGKYFPDKKVMAAYNN